MPTGVGDYPEDLDEYFEEDGRWAIAVIAGFNLTAIIANYALFDVSVLDPMNIWNMIAIAIAVVVVRATRSVVQGAATITYGIWLGLYMWTFVPSAY